MPRDYHHNRCTSQDKQALQRLAEASEKAKVELSSLNEAGGEPSCEPSSRERSPKHKVRISVPFITADDSGPKHVEEVLTREHFEDLALSNCEVTSEGSKLADLAGSLWRPPRMSGGACEASIEGAPSFRSDGPSLAQSGIVTWIEVASFFIFMQRKCKQF